VRTWVRSCKVTSVRFGFEAVPSTCSVPVWSRPRGKTSSPQPIRCNAHTRMHEREGNRMHACQLPLDSYWYLASIPTLFHISPDAAARRTDCVPQMLATDALSTDQLLVVCRRVAPPRSLLLSEQPTSASSLSLIRMYGVSLMIHPQSPSMLSPSHTSMLSPSHDTPIFCLPHTIDICAVSLPVS